MSPNPASALAAGIDADDRLIACRLARQRRYDEPGKERPGARVWLAMFVAESGPAVEAARLAERLEFRIIFFGVADAKLIMS
jgi:hypothetical protein